MIDTAKQMMEKKTDIFDRLDFLIENQNLNISSFAKKIGLGDQTLRNIIANRRNEPSYKVILAISQTFDWLNLDWLILGKGEMIKASDQSVVISVESAELNSMKDDLIASLKKQVVMLEDKVNELQRAPASRDF